LRTTLRNVPLTQSVEAVEKPSKSSKISSFFYLSAVILVGEGGEMARYKDYSRRNGDILNFQQGFTSGLIDLVSNLSGT